MRRDMAALRRKIIQGQRKAARTARPVVVDKAPKAFGPLRESIHVVDQANGARIVADAPHAAALEVGSRPHWAPLQPLIEWVILRGMQGITASKRRGLAPKHRAQAAWVADRIAEFGDGSSSPTSAPVEVARAIQHKIAVRGTPPTNYMGGSQGEIFAILDVTLTELLKSQSLD